LSRIPCINGVFACATLQRTIRAYKPALRQFA
jgi:hypothetical protein